MRCGVGAFWVGSRLDPWCFLLDFFFVAAVVVVAAAEFVGADAALDCCGLRAAVATLTGCADAEDAYTSNASTSDAAIESLVIFLRSVPCSVRRLLQTKRAARAHPYYGDFPRALKAGTSVAARIEQPARNKVGCRRARRVCVGAGPANSGRTHLFRLTSYPKALVFGLYAYPRCARTSRIAAGHAGSADPAHADFRRAARPRHRARHPTNVG